MRSEEPALSEAEGTPAFSALSEEAPIGTAEQAAEKLVEGAKSTPRALKRERV